MLNLFDENTWYYDEDMLFWSVYIEEYDLEFSIEDSTRKLTDSMIETAVNSFADMDFIFHESEKIIMSLPPHPAEKGKQDWKCDYILIPENTSGRIEALWSESNFDIYRLWHVCFIHKNKSWQFLELTNSSI